MRQTQARSAVRPQPFAAFAWSLTVLLSLVLLLTPHLAHAAIKDADVMGRWIADRARPELDYAVSPGPAGKLTVAVPAAAVGRAKGELVTLDRIRDGYFATPKGAPVHASFTAKDPRHAEFKLFINRPNALNLGDQLLERP